MFSTASSTAPNSASDNTVSGHSVKGQKAKPDPAILTAQTSASKDPLTSESFALRKKTQQKPDSPTSNPSQPSEAHEGVSATKSPVASFDSVRRYLDFLPGENTYGPAQGECSDGMTEDSGEDDTSVYSESNSASDALGETTYENSELNVHEVSAAVLENAKRALVNQLMQEVWVRFDKHWTDKFTACAGSDTTSSIPPSWQTASTSAQGTVQKRQREDDDDDNSSSDDHGRAPKRSIPQ
jgi:hypothetical protein